MSNPWDGPNWVTWCWHGGLGILYTVVALTLLKWVPAWAVPGLFAAFFYGVRELEGRLYSGHWSGPWYDHVLDVVVPAAAGLVTAAVLWHVGLRWT